METLESLATNVAANVAANFITWIGNSVYKSMLKDNPKKYKLELENLIFNSVVEYRMKFPNHNELKIPFYDSEVFFSELLKFRFTKDINKEVLKKAIENDPRILVPTTADLEQFLTFFFEKLDSSETLKELYIEQEWKREIFEISSELKTIESVLAKTIEDFKLELHKTGVAAALSHEWLLQLDEINDFLQQFKPKSALQRLESLEKRLNESGILTSDNIKAKVLYLTGICLTELDDTEIDKNTATYFITPYKLSPNNPDYKIQAGLAYCSLGDEESMKKALQIADEILSVEEFHHGAWVIKCYSKKENVIQYLKEVPETTFQKKEFKIHISHFLLQKKYVDAYTKLVDLGLEIQSKDSEPTKITHKNRGFWLIMSSLFLNKFFEMNPVLNSNLEVKEKSKDTIVYIQGLLNKIIRAVEGTEIEKKHSYFKFYLHYINLLLSKKQEEIYEMEKAYFDFPHKTFLDVFIMSQSLSSTKKKDDIQKAIALISEYGEEKNEVLCIFKACNYLMIDEDELSKQTFKKFISLHTIIDKNFVFNVIEYYRSSRFLKSEELKKDIDEMLLLFSESTPLKDLLHILLYSGYKFEFENSFPVYEKIKFIQSEVDKSDIHLGVLISEAFIQTGFTEEAINQLKPFIDFSKPSYELKLYCRFLNRSNSHKTELLMLLENWRKSFSPDHELLRTEVHLRQLNNNWKKIIEISLIGFQHFSDDETFLFGLIAGYGYENNVEKIKELIPTVFDYKFQNKEFESFIAGVLLKNGFASESLEILYRIANDESNKKARQTFLTSTIGYPPDLFKGFEKVEVGTFVKYEISGKEYIREITEENKDTHPISGLVGKIPGDSILISNIIDGSIKNGHVLRVMNKYVALCEQILIESKDPMSTYGITTFEFKELTVESVNATMTELFGASGSVKKDQTQDALNKYYSGEYSFSEITSTVFQKNYIDAYFTLSSKTEKSFLALSSGIARRMAINEHTRYVIDASSLCLFFELSKELGINYEHKFVVTPLLKQLIKGMVDEAKIDPSPAISLSVTLEGVKPFFYNEDYKEKRIEFYSEILQWMDENCEVDFVEDKLDLISDLPEKLKMDGFIQYLADNAIMAQRPNYYLLTNDNVYFKSLKGSPDNIVSPEVYLKKFTKGNMNEITSFMLNHNYIGIHITNEILQDELLKMLSGRENKFALCLENLNFGWSPIADHIPQSVLFLKWLYLLPILSNEQRERIAIQILHSLTRGMSTKGMMLISFHIDKHFRLLGEKYDQVILAYSNALKV